MEGARRKVGRMRWRSGGRTFADVILRYPAVLAALVDAPEPAAIRIEDAESFADGGSEFGGGVVAEGYGRLAAPLEEEGGRPAAFAARIGTPEPAPGRVVVPEGDVVAEGDGFACLKGDGVGELGGVVADDLGWLTRFRVC